MCRSSLWNFLVCDMYYILYMLDFSYPFLLKITIAILLNSLRPAAFALSGWLLKVCNFTTTKNYQNLAQKITSKFY